MLSAAEFGPAACQSCQNCFSRPLILDGIAESEVRMQDALATVDHNVVS